MQISCFKRYEHLEQKCIIFYRIRRNLIQDLSQNVDGRLNYDLWTHPSLSNKIINKDTFFI